ncbi:hypothetical protein F5883DRAFT_70211 [Diaporthe sp. PMI_573]|nr:hypothetical protein F5883DRAFT_70211 [Diaporthaceae sp. PMI_573]
MPTERHALGLCQTLLSWFQSRGINFFHISRLGPEVLVSDMRSIFLDGYIGVQNVVRHITHPAPGQGTVTPQSVVLGNNQQVTNTDRQPEGTLIHLRNHNGPSTSEAGYSAEEAGRPAISRGDSSHKTPYIRSKRTWMWIVALIVGVLSLIVVPGIIVGFMTRQMSWGVELSGAIAPIISFLAGLYYYHNK